MWHKIIKKYVVHFLERLPFLYSSYLIYIMCENERFCRNYMQDWSESPLKHLELFL